MFAEADRILISRNPEYYTEQDHAVRYRKYGVLHFVSIQRLACRSFSACAELLVRLPVHRHIVATCASPQSVTVAGWPQADSAVPGAWTC